MRYLFVCVRRSICSLSLPFPEQHTFNSIWIEYRKTKALRRHLSHGNRNNNVYARKRKKEYRNKERKLILKSNEKPYQSTNTNPKTHKLCTTYVDFSKFFLFFWEKKERIIGLIYIIWLWLFLFRSSLYFGFIPSKFTFVAICFRIRCWRKCWLMIYLIKSIYVDVYVYVWILFLSQYV